MNQHKLDETISNGEKRYVLDIAARLGYELELVKHPEGAHTCEERAKVLGVRIANVVKSIYFSHESEYIGVICSGDTKRIVPRDIFSAMLGISRSKANKYLVRENRMPKGMSYGCCTPFPLESSLEAEVKNLIFVPSGVEGLCSDV